MTRRRGSRVVGLGTALGAFLAFGLTAPVAVPSAHADFDAGLDQIFAPFLDAATSTVDWDAVSTPAAWESFLGSAHWDAVFAELSQPGDVATLFAAPAAYSAPASDLWLHQFVYLPLHTAVQDWINSSGPTPVLDALNSFSEATGLGPMIANGADGTLTHVQGFNGGWLFGDGGAGYSAPDAGVAGAGGGAAGFFGNGGAGGAGGDGAPGGTGGAGGTVMGIGGAGGDGGVGTVGVLSGVGGAGGAGGVATGWLFGVGGAGGAGGNGPDGGYGGDGGDATGLFGVGGHGGDAGDSGVGGAPAGLPALGGAGGNGGWLGAHGAVGDYGGGVQLSGNSYLGHTGTWVTDNDGRAVILHGFNQVYKVPPFTAQGVGFGDKDAEFLAANGFNVVRLGLIWEAVEPAPGVYNDAYLAQIQETVDTLEAHGIRVYLDMHQDQYSSVFGAEGAPAWAVQTGGLFNNQVPFPYGLGLNPAMNHAWDAFWSNSHASGGVGLQNHYAQMWQYVANYFKDEPNVVGYDVMNEPWAGSEWWRALLGDSHFEAQQLTPFYNQVASAIRSIDPTTPVYYEPQLLFGLGLPTQLGTVEESNSLFSFHAYCLSTVIFNSDAGCGPILGGILDNAMAYANSHDIPAMTTEFGNNPVGLGQIVGLLNQAQLGWAKWEYTALNDPATTGPGSLVNNPHEPLDAPGNVNVDVLKATAEPYPQAVAGTPGSWSFNNGTFTFSYSTEMVDGSGSFAAGSQTEIAVPAIQYPNGYQVTVTGGHVVSAPGAAQLIIESAAGASTVSVTVSPVSP